MAEKNSEDKRGIGRPGGLSSCPWWPEVEPHYMYEKNPDPSEVYCRTKDPIHLRCPSCGKEKSITAPGLYNAQHAALCPTCLAIERHKQKGDGKPVLDESEFWKTNGENWVDDDENPNPHAITEHSGKFATVRCPECGETRRVRIQNWTMSDGLCRPCAIRHGKKLARERREAEESVAKDHE